MLKLTRAALVTALAACSTTTTPPPPPSAPLANTPAAPSSIPRPTATVPHPTATALATLPPYTPTDEELRVTYGSHEDSGIILFPGGRGFSQSHDEFDIIDVPKALARVIEWPVALKPRYELACALARAGDLGGARGVLEELLRAGGERGAEAMARARNDRTCGLAAIAPAVAAPTVPAYVVGVRNALTLLEQRPRELELAPGIQVTIEHKRATSPARALARYTRDRSLSRPEWMPCADGCCDADAPAALEDLFVVHRICVDLAAPTRVTVLEIVGDYHTSHTDRDGR